MYIIIVGGGRVGASLCRELTGQGHEVLMIERDRERCAQLQDELGSGVILGDGCEAATLTEAGGERADVFIAVTDGDEDNLVACQVARHRSHVAHVIARVNIPRNERIFKLLGIECTVNAVEALTNNVLLEVPGQSLTRLVRFQQDGLALVGIRIPDTARSVGKKITDIPLPESSTVSAVIQSDHLPHVPTPETILQPNDEVIILARREDEPALVAALAS